MGNDNTERMLGQVDGKLDELIRSMTQWQADHNARHAKIDEKLEQHSAALNQAKGAKAAIYTVAAVIAGGVGFVVSAAEKLLK